MDVGDVAIRREHRGAGTRDATGTQRLGSAASPSTTRTPRRVATATYRVSGSWARTTTCSPSRSSSSRTRRPSSSRPHTTTCPPAHSCAAEGSARRRLDQAVSRAWRCRGSGVPAGQGGVGVRVGVGAGAAGDTSAAGGSEAAARCPALRPIPIHRRSGMSRRGGRARWLRRRLGGIDRSLRAHTRRPPRWARSSCPRHRATGRDGPDARDDRWRAWLHRGLWGRLGVRFGLLVGLGVGVAGGTTTWPSTTDHSTLARGGPRGAGHERAVGIHLRVVGQAHERHAAAALLIRRRADRP